MKLLKQMCALILAIGMALTMSGINVCADNDLYQLKIDSKSIDSGSITYTVSCGTAMTGLALCCVYDDNGVLVSVGTKKANNDETVTVTAKTQADKGMTKIMLWNSLEDISPLATAVTDNWEKNTTNSGIKIDTSKAVEEIPSSYSQSAEHGGRVVKINYETNTYDAENKDYSKYAYVYLPYGYDESEQYDVFYLLHGGGGNAERYFDGEGQESEFKKILDHMIEDGKLKPLLVVTPSFYPNDNTDTSVSTAGVQTAKFHNELVNDLIPAVEGTYSTYAKTTDSEGLRVSREHRAFGGFSMGSVATWYTLINCPEYFKYYMPLSGDCWIMAQQGGASRSDETAAYLDNVIKTSGYAWDDFFIYALTGTDDIAYNAMNGQINAMKNYTDSFKFVSAEESGNICYRLKDGGTHDYVNIRQYIYNALPVFWTRDEQTSEQTDERKIKVTIGNTTGYITDLTDNSTTKAFLEMLPLTQSMNDLHGREYWFSHTLPYDDDSVQHTYDIGEFTYWCGGWVTAYYDRDDDDVIEAGSVVIGTMDDTLVDAFHKLNGSAAEVTFELDEAKGKSYDFDKTYEYETRQINTDNNGANIYGMAYIPKDAGDTVPTVIISHGYGGSNTTNRNYAEYLASHGIAAYCFDFRGGGNSSNSDGKTTDMTIFTEKSDLNAVLDKVKELDFVDTDNLFLMGTSQGGLVSAMTAPDRASEISGAILFYPALCIVDNTHERYSTVSAIPETTNFMGMTVGRDYFESVYDYDVYTDITRYTEDVIIVHGTADSVVPLSYSQKAAQEYNSAELKIINGGGHGFYGSDADTATEYVMEYIKNHVN